MDLLKALKNYEDFRQECIDQGKDRKEIEKLDIKVRDTLTEVAVRKRINGEEVDEVMNALFAFAAKMNLKFSQLVH